MIGSGVAGRRRLAALAAAPLLLGALAGCGGGAAAADAGGDTGFVAGDGSVVLLDPAARQPAPDLVGTTLSGETFSLAEQRGDVVVLNVWASWCAPCRAEAPGMARVARELEPAGAVFVGLNTRDSATAATAFEESYDIPYPSIADTDGRLQLLFRDTLPPQAIPSTVVIDREGRVAGRVLGKASEATLRGLLEPLLAEGGGAPPSGAAAPSGSAAPTGSAAP